MFVVKIGLVKVTDWICLSCQLIGLCQLEKDLILWELLLIGGENLGYGLVLHSVDFAAGSELIQITSDRFKGLIATYSNPKSFVNFLLPPLAKGRAGVG